MYVPIDNYNLARVFCYSLLTTIFSFSLIVYLASFFGVTFNYDLLGKLMLGFVFIITCQAMSRGRNTLFQAAAVSTLMLTFTLAVIYVMGNLIEIQPDGMTAHLEAVDLLRRGWNPVYGVGYQGMPEAVASLLFLENADNYVRLLGGRFSYIAFATLSGVFEMNEGGRALSLILGVCAFFLLMDIFPKHKYRVSLVVLIVFANPIFLGFLYSHYIDPIFYICFLIFFSVLHKVSTTSTIVSASSKIDLILLLLSACFFCGVKASGFPTLIAGSFIYFLGFIIFLRDRTVRLSNTVKSCLKIFVLVCFAGLVATISPFGINLVAFGKPSIFFDSYGGIENAINIVWAPQAEWFNSHNVFERLFHSIFSYTEVNPDVVPNLKLPFTIGKIELVHLFNLNADSRIGGFGPLFGCTFLLGIVVVFGQVIKQRRFTISAYALCGVLVLTLLNPFSFWARFVPFLWLAPIFGVTSLWFDVETYRVRVAGLLLFALISMNSLIYFVSFNAGFLKNQAIITSELMVVKKLDRPNIYFSNYGSLEVLLKEMGINFQKVGKCEAAKLRLTRTEVEVCAN